MRFTLPKLFLAVGLAGLACAGMASPTHWWVNSILTLTVVLYAFAASRAIGLRGRDRVAAIAFAVFGSVYLLLVTCNEFRTIGKALVTNYPLAMAASARGLVSAPTYLPMPYYPPATPSVYQPATAPPQPYQPNPATTDTITVSPAPSFAAPTTSDGSSPPPPSSRLTPTVAVPPALIAGPSFGSVTLATPSLDEIISSAMSQNDYWQPLVWFFLIGHCVWSWLIALSGAWLCGRIYSKAAVAPRN